MVDRLDRQWFGELADAVAAAERVNAVGARTQWEVGGPPPADAIEVRVASGVIAYDPDDLTVTVAAGTTCAELATVLGEQRQQCPLDPRDPQATVGGVLACGLSGLRRLRWGPVRDQVLEVRFVTADGTLVKGGGPTVKNVSGYDLPRLLVGSLGTLGVIARVTLRCQPEPAASVWCTTALDPFAVRAAVLRPGGILLTEAGVRVLLEGEAADVAHDLAALGGAECAAPALPEGPHRGRISLPPAELRTLVAGLPATKVDWAAELGVGTVHVAAVTPGPVLAARELAQRLGGWLLREAGLPGDDGFGVTLPNAAVMSRIAAAFDPKGTCAPGRLPLVAPPGASTASQRESADVL
jgi:glycolate oxidase FAD binding subunit